MLDANLFPLRNYLPAPVELLPAGHPDLAVHLPVLPPTWQFALGSASRADDAVEALWAPLHERARGWVTRLATVTDGFALAVSPEAAFRPGLFYIVAGLGSTPHGWLAGLPVRETELDAAEARLGRPLPSSYRRFLQIHDGFMENGDPQVGFAPLAALDWLADRSGSAQPGLLGFFGDGFGKRQCYNPAAPAGQGDLFTVTWDHQTGATRRSQSFWSFLKELTVYGFG